jgi:hypothetical protein
MIYTLSLLMFLLFPLYFEVVNAFVMRTVDKKLMKKSLHIYLKLPLN